MAIMTREERMALTADGRLSLHSSVTATKLSAVKNLVEDTLSGNRIARGTLEEVLTSSDALFSYAQYTNLNFIPEFDRAPRTWSAIADERTVPNFKKPVLYNIVTNWNGLGDEGPDAPAATYQNEGVMPIVPEGAPYPYASMTGEEALSGGIVKRGFRTGFTFEAFIDDFVGYIAALPEQMLRIALDTEDYDVYNTLTNGATLAANQLIGGTTPDGSTVVSNSPLTREALVEAKVELSKRTVSGRQVQVSGGYNLIVPIGQALNVNYFLNSTWVYQNPGVTAGPSFDVSAYNPLADVTVIESRWISGTKWFLLPKPGATARPVISHLKMLGYEAPELRIENIQGDYVGGGAVSPFQGSFSNDTTDLRVRNLGGAVLWTPALVVYSRGDSSAVS